MFIPSHIRVASRVMRYSGEAIKLRYRFLFILGSITPDLIMQYPDHQVVITWKRVEKYLISIEKRGRRSFLDAWRLGIVLHYMCDYFCRAHNDGSILHGIKHSVYEFHLCKIVKYFSELPDYMEIKSSREFLKVLKNKHNEYIEKLKDNKHSMYDDVFRALTMGTNLVSTYKNTLV